MGLPEDDEESLNETYEFIKKYPYVTTAGFFLPNSGDLNHPRDKKQWVAFRKQCRFRWLPEKF